MNESGAGHLIVVISRKRLIEYISPNRFDDSMKAANNSALMR
jgi:hypothetical protein